MEQQTIPEEFLVVQYKNPLGNGYITLHIRADMKDEENEDLRSFIFSKSLPDNLQLQLSIPYIGETFRPDKTEWVENFFRAKCKICSRPFSPSNPRVGHNDDEETFICLECSEHGGHEADNLSFKPFEST